MIDLDSVDSMVNKNAPPTFQRIFQQLSKEQFDGAFDAWNVYGWLPEFYINRINHVRALCSNGTKHVEVYTEYWQRPYTFICFNRSSAYDLIEEICEELNKKIAIYKLMFDI